MDLPRNTFKAALKAGQRQIGIWTTFPDPGMVEMLAGTGYDWMVIDGEHTPLSPEGVLPLLQAASAYPVQACARPGWNDATMIKKMMDAGAQTIIVPYVQTAEEAAAAVSATHYPPAGTRGMAGVVRAARWGAIPDYATRANDEVCTIIQTETKEALDALDDIVTVPGLDGVFIGPADLSASLGHPGNSDHPEVRSAMLDAIRRIRDAGLAPGILTDDDDLLRDAEAAGALFLAVGIDAGLLRRQALERRRIWS